MALSGQVERRRGRGRGRAGVLCGEASMGRGFNNGGSGQEQDWQRGLKANRQGRTRKHSHNWISVVD